MPLCHDESMKRSTIVALGGVGLLLAMACPAVAQTPPAKGQGPVELKSTAPETRKPFEIVTPGPSSREITRVPEAEFYREDQRVPYQPGFVEPLVTTTPGGTKVGASAWTAPQPPTGSLASQGYQQNNGWFGFGITFIWDSPPPPAPSHTPPR
jgi:hypothetical protein